MTPRTLNALLIALGLAIAAGIIVFVLKNEQADGSARPLGERIRLGVLTALIAAANLVFAVMQPLWYGIFFITWWTCLFAVLPFGITSQHETGLVPRGTDPGAPVSPGLPRKAWITTAVSLPVCFGLYLLTHWFQLF